LLYCRLPMGRVKYHKPMWLQTGNEKKRRCLLTYQRHQRPDCQNRITWNQVCVLARHIDDVSSAKLYQQRISCLYVVMKKIYNFREKSELPKFILPVKISWLIFSAVSRVEMKNLQRSRQAHFLLPRPCRSISCSQLCHTRLCSSVSLLAGYLLHSMLYPLNWEDMCLIFILTPQ